MIINKKLKKILAGCSLASLITSAGLVTGCSENTKVSDTKNEEQSGPVPKNSENNGSFDKEIGPTDEAIQIRGKSG
jgi:hypothetical protein